VSLANLLTPDKFFLLTMRSLINHQSFLNRGEPTMRTILVLFVMLVSVSGFAKPFAQMNSKEAKDYFTIQAVETTEITPEQLELDQLLAAADDCDPTKDPFCETPSPKPSPAPTENPEPKPTETSTPTRTGSIKIDEIIAIGEKIWKFIDDNKPVVTQRFGGLSILPGQVKSLEEMEGWSEPQVKIYKTVFKNKLGMNPIEFTYRVSYTYGGSYEGVGKFISRVEIEPAHIKALWGYKLDAQSELLNIHNAGSKNNPVAAVDIRVSYTINNVLLHTQESSRFYLTGGGLYKDLTRGNLSTLRLR
jgi:hypothetical protein